MHSPRVDPHEMVVVAVTTTLLERLSPERVEAVLAHELSHIKNRGMAMLTISKITLDLHFTTPLLDRLCLWWWLPVGYRSNLSHDLFVLSKSSPKTFFL
ncbi:MAG: M48 family metalloprotease [Methanocellales archaeon]|nr:M48 family metalloprotease [Methanocellales archaeon]